MENCIILGSGPAGCTAAIYLARAGLAPLVIEGPTPGGLLTQTTEIENFPGFENGIDGFELMDTMKRQAERFGARFDMSEITGVDFSKQPLLVKTATATLEAKTVIIATGASARYLGLPAEKALIGKGVSGCATCDGAFFRGKDVAVIGGGDTACEDALFLARICKSVTMIHRRDELRASAIMADRVINHPNITMAWDSTVIDIDDVTAQKVTAIHIQNLKTQAVTIKPVDALFVAIGHAPNTKFLTDAIDIQKTGYLTADPTNGHTSATGVFSAGDVHDPHYRQAIVAAGSGCIAALEAERYLATL